MERVRPGGNWSTTEEPTIIVKDGVATIECDTEGASIAYMLGEKDGSGPEHWLLYHQPFDVPEGAKLKAMACRLGYRDSPVVTAGQEAK